MSLPLCKAMTAQNKKCTRRTLLPSDLYCWQHSLDGKTLKGISPKTVDLGKTLDLKIKTGVILCEYDHLPDRIQKLADDRIVDDYAKVKDKIAAKAFPSQVAIKTFQATPTEINITVEKPNGLSFDEVDIERLILQLYMGGLDDELGIIDPADWASEGDTDLRPYLLDCYKCDPDVDFDAIKYLEQFLQLTAINGVQVNLSKGGYYTGFTRGNRFLKVQVNEIVDRLVAE
jgi:hypothetical protein